MGDLHFRSAFFSNRLNLPDQSHTEGPLSGLTVAIKDMFDIAGERVSGGNPAWLDSQKSAQKNSSVVDRLLSSGATIVGKTICDEFFYSVTGINHHFGTPLNPRAPGCIPGGSSSGSASAASAGSCDFSIGSDTGGSVRVPAALCGIYGIRVTHGRIDLTGAMGMAPSFDAGGWFSAVPGVFSRVGQALLENYRQPTKSIKRFKVASDMFSLAQPEVSSICLKFLDGMSDQINVADRIDIAGSKIDSWRENFRVVQAFEVWQTFGSFIESKNPQMGPGVLERMMDARKKSEDDALRARAELSRVRARMEELTSDNTVLALPTCPVTAPSQTSTLEELNDYRIRTMRMVCAASISGLPQVTIPIGSVRGAPVGLSFLGWRNSDEELLYLARSLAPYIGMATV